MKRTHKLCLALVSAVAVSGSALLAYALPASDSETDYYSDAGFTNEVGWSYLSCSGHTSRSGRTSRYAVHTRESCHTSGPISIACTLDGVPTLCPPNICDSHLVGCN